MLKQLDGSWWEGDYILIKDKGKPSEIATTHIYEVTYKKGGVLIGYIRWSTPWRGYSFFPLPTAVLNSNNSVDLGTFCADMSKIHFERIKARRKKPKRIFSLVNVEEYRKKRDADREARKVKGYF